MACTDNSVSDGVEDELNALTAPVKWKIIPMVPDIEIPRQPTALITCLRLQKGEAGVLLAMWHGAVCRSVGAESSLLAFVQALRADQNTWGGGQSEQ